jgi:hypothetical protein
MAWEAAGRWQEAGGRGSDWQSRAAGSPPLVLAPALPPARPRKPPAGGGLAGPGGGGGLAGPSPAGGGSWLATSTRTRVWSPPVRDARMGWPEGRHARKICSRGRHGLQRHGQAGVAATGADAGAASQADAATAVTAAVLPLPLCHYCRRCRCRCCCCCCCCCCCPAAHTSSSGFLSFFSQ